MGTEKIDGDDIVFLAVQTRPILAVVIKFKPSHTSAIGCEQKCLETSYHLQRVRFATDGHFEHVRLALGADVAEDPHKFHACFPIGERMEFRAVALGKRLVEVGKCRHLALIWR